MTQVQEINPRQLTVEQAYDQWFTVPKRPPSKQEREALNRPDNSTTPSRTWKWPTSSTTLSVTK